MVIERVENHGGGFNVLPGTCAVWLDGTCEARFCAADEVAAIKGLNQTYQWLGQQLDGLFWNCILTGHDGLGGDCEDLNGGCGLYRLHFGHRGNEWQNVTVSSGI